MIGFRFGESFNQGDLLIGFDCGFYQADLAANRAAAKAASAQHRNNLKLLSLNAASQIEVELSAARQEEAVAKQSRAASQIDRCQVFAPFDGTVDSLYVNPHESVSP
ncbi:MAG: hypothetical protein JKY30_07350, partial [Flavobacteriales bacterium]|nr:hypothetical protein [Flavobacteriales bacterium]